MKSETNATPISAEEIAGPRHACAFFDGTEEEYRVLMPFATGCARCGDRCFHFADPAQKAERARKLAEAHAGILPQRHAAELRDWSETYLRGGGFVADRMLDFLRELVDRANGLPRARVWANMEWAVQNVGLLEELVDYERRVNSVVDCSDALIVCVYQCGRYTADVAFQVLRAHPWIVVQGRLEPNPVFEAPGIASDR